MIERLIFGVCVVIFVTVMAGILASMLYEIARTFSQW